MRNMLAFRFVLLSCGDAVRASPRLLRLEAALSQQRRQRHDLMLAALVDNRFVTRTDNANECSASRGDGAHP